MNKNKPTRTTPGGAELARNAARRTGLRAGALRAVRARSFAVAALAGLTASTFALQPLDAHEEPAVLPASGSPSPGPGASTDGFRVWVGDTGAPVMPRLEAGPGSGAQWMRTLSDRADGWRTRLGITTFRADGRTRWLAEGTELSVPLLAGRLYASQERRHWGPGMNSLFLDGQALPVGAVGWRREQREPFQTPWLRWLGPWSADFFVGRLHGHEQPRRPWLIGMRIDLEPVEGLTVGLTRTLMWGGQGRDEGLKSLARALIGRDNAGDNGLDVHTQPGNQMAGVDLRYDGRWGEQGRWSVYGQIAGEDEAGGMPSKFLVLAGAAIGTGRWRLEAEWADTGMRHAYGDYQSGAYRHIAFSRGYTHLGTTLGHPIGGDAVLRTVAASHRGPAVQTRLALHRGRSLIGSPYFADGERLTGASLALQAPASVPWRWSGTINLLRHGGRTDRSLQLGLSGDW